MACRFPGAADVDEYWANLIAGRDCLTELSDEELLRRHENPERLARSDYVRKRPVLVDSDMFDARLFGVSPREAEIRDPQYRLMLESVHAVLEHAGYDPAAYPGQIGLFAGPNVNRYRYDHIERRPDVVQNVGYLAVDVNNHPDYMATYVSYKLGLRGPAATVLTACSTSLVAVHMACTAIRAGDCDMAVAGGVDIEPPYHRGYLYIQGGIYSRDGTVRAFDTAATGTNFGDGVGTVLLKPLSAALRDNDTIYATILGSAINNDGDRKVGYTAPSVAGQSECIRLALTRSGVHPRDISYVEAHGTATRMGDPIELAGITDAFRTVSKEPLPSQYCAIASVKSNIGHLSQAAGVAGLIKAALALTHRRLPASINVTEPNPEIDWANSPFYVNTELRDWHMPSGQPRHAGISSFGIGGTNAHVVLREPPAIAPSHRSATPAVITWSAVDAEAESALRGRLSGYFARLADDRFPDAAYTLRVGRTPLAVRGALLADGAADAADALADDQRVIRADAQARSTVFVLPGQGAQVPGMYRALYAEQEVFRRGCDSAFEVLRPLLDVDLRAVWQSATDPADLAATELAQPLLYVMEYTLAHCLKYWDVTPDVLLGHSVGELAAAAVAGVFDFEDGLRAVAARALHMAQMPPGRMLAVTGTEADVADVLHDGLVVAAINSPRQVVLAGAADAVDAAAAELAGRGAQATILRTSKAFHSRLMAPAVAPFEAALKKLTLRPPAVPVISAATGALLTDEQAVSPAFWAGQLCLPVQFDRAATTLLALGAASMVEVGPGRTLAGLIRGRTDVRATRSRVLPTAVDTNASALDETLARLWVDGIPVNYARLDEGRGFRRIAVPGYPYQRRRFWVDPLADSDAATDAPVTAVLPTSASAAPTPAPLAANYRLAELDWVRSPVPVLGAGPLSGSAVLLAPADAAIAAQALSALQRAGYRTVPVVAGDAFDPTSPDEWVRRLDTVPGRPDGPVILAHAALLTAPTDVDLDTLEAQLTVGFDAVHAAAIAAAGVRRRRRVPTSVLVLGRGLVDLTGAEPINPASAAVLGLLTTAEAEIPGLRCHAVDIAGPVPDHLVGAVIAAGDAPVCALRGSSQWLPRLRPSQPTPAEPALRPRGTYLITGGLGGIGLVTARTLAETGLRPRLALLGRTTPADLPDKDRDRVLAEIAALETAGAEVEVFPADVTDLAALTAAVRAVEERFGAPHGVVHAAGVPGGRLLERRKRADARRVMLPKAAGVLAIESVFATRAPLDFLLLFSSQAGQAGMYGSADYAAANAFLDAHARRCAGDDRRTVSVQWPGWAEVGMLARSATGQALFGGSSPAAGFTGANGADPIRPADDNALEHVAVEVLRVPGLDWEFDEHVFADVPVLPGTAMVELAVRAGWEGGVAAPGRPIELDDVVFLAPVVGDGPTRIRVTLAATAGVHRFRLQSRPATDEGAWIDNAVGNLSPGVEVTGAALPKLRERRSRDVGARSADWIRYGPRWAAATQTWGDGDERVARLILPERYHDDLAEHPVHPAILDNAAGVLTDWIPGRTYAPFRYRRIAVFGSLPADVSVHARFAASSDNGSMRPVDFDVYDTATGRLLVRAEAFTGREVPKDGFRQAHEGRGRPGASAAGRPELLRPDEGTTVLRQLLDHAQPPVVLVDLTARPLAVPGIPWVDEAPEAPGKEPADRVAPTAVQVPAQPSATATTVSAVPPAGSAGPARPDTTEDEVTNVLRGLWCDALGVAAPDLDDDFFDLGGDSLGAVQLAARISRHFGIELGAGAIFDSPTLRALGAEVRGSQGAVMAEAKQ